MAEPDYIHGLLDAGDFSDIDIKGWTGGLPYGGPGSTPSDATRFALDFYHSQILAKQSPDVREIIADELHGVFSRYHGDEGVVMGAKVWLVTARG